MSDDINKGESGEQAAAPRESNCSSKTDSNGFTVKEMIEWLKTQDQDAIVEVIERIAGRRYEGDTFERRPFHPVDYSQYTDMRGNQFAKGTLYENNRYLLLGAD